MNNFKNLPMDIVKTIVLYDNRFVIRNGEIILINKLDTNKYKTAILNLLLLKKPQIYSIRTMSTSFCEKAEWEAFCVEFSNRYGIHYNIGYMGNKNFIRYTFGYNEEYCYSPIQTMDIL
jgi:hypothetical protein